MKQTVNKSQSRRGNYFMQMIVSYLFQPAILLLFFHHLPNKIFSPWLESGLHQKSSGGDTLSRNMLFLFFFGLAISSFSSWFLFLHSVVLGIFFWCNDSLISSAASYTTTTNSSSNSGAVWVGVNFNHRLTLERPVVPIGFKKKLESMVELNELAVSWLVATETVKINWNHVLQ